MSAQLARAAATLGALRTAIGMVPLRDENEDAGAYGRRLRDWGWSQSTLAKLAGAIMCAASDEIDLPVQAVEPDKCTFDRTEYQRRYMANRREASKSAG
jgi:hypothetical protein